MPSTLSALPPLLALVAFGIAAPLLLPMHAGTLAMLWLLVALALGWCLLAACTGYVSLGDILFFVIGMQVSATLFPWIQQVLFGQPPDGAFGLPATLAITLPAAGIAAMLAASLLGVLLLGMRRQLFTLSTLALVLLAGELSASQPLAGIPLASVLSASYGHLLSLHHMAFLLALLAILLHLWLRSSGLRLALQVIAEDEGRAIATGHFTHRNKVVAWAIGACLAGMAGALYGMLQPVLLPDIPRLVPTNPVEIGALVILIVLLGGGSAPWGVIIAAFALPAIMALPHSWLADSQLPALHGLITGVLILVIATWMSRAAVGRPRPRHAPTDSTAAPRGVFGATHAAPAPLPPAMPIRACTGRQPAMPEASRRILHRPALLEVRHLRARPAVVPGINDVSLSVEHGTIVGLLGPADCGMQTLLDCIGGITVIDSGETWFDGEPTTCLRVDRIARLGLLRTFRHPRVFPGMTCMENMLACRLAGRATLRDLFWRVPRREVSRARELLAFLDLHAQRHQRAAALPPWRRKLLECGMALMSEPRLLLLDEPFDGMPAAVIDAHAERLQRLNAERGLSLLVADRALSAFMDVAEHVYVLCRGRVLRAGPPQEIRGDDHVMCCLRRALRAG